MSHIFLSYARVDVAYVRGLATWLTLGGVEVWLDEEVWTSQLWEDVIVDRLLAAQALIVVMTPQAGASPWVAREVELARALGKPVHPLLLRGDIILGLADVQYEDVRDGRLPSPQFRARLSGLVPRRPVVTRQFGLIPPLAAYFRQRQVARQTGPGVMVLSGLGGVGKTQLAAELAVRLRDTGSLDLLIWVSATSREAVIEAYAQAAAQVVPGADPGEPERSARALLADLSATTTRWLVVLDDLQDPDHLTGWWPPQTATGQVVVTTRRTDSALVRRGTFIDVGTFTADEAHGYLAAAFAAHPGRLAGGAELAADLGLLPLALAQASAYIDDAGITCAQYRELFADRRHRLLSQLAPDALPDDYARGVAVTMALGVDAADRLAPQGLASRLLELLSLLDSNGIPRGLATTSSAVNYVGVRAGVDPSTVDVDSVLANLSKLSLAAQDAESGLVRVHALVQRTCLDRVPATAVPALSQAGADSLAEFWYGVDQRGDVRAGAVLRANAAALRVVAGDDLYRSEAHVVLFREGTSLLDAGLYDAGVEHFRRLSDEVGTRFGPEHTDRLLASNELGRAYQAQGRAAEAAALFESILPDSERAFGPAHPNTLGVRNNLANAYAVLGRSSSAIDMYRRNVAAMEREHGAASDDERVLTSRANLALALQEAGRVAEAIPLHESVLTARVRVLGPDHPETLVVRNNLAIAYQEAGRIEQAIAVTEANLADRERVLGAEHPSTLTSRNNLGRVYIAAGRIDEATAILEDVTADLARTMGPDHPQVFVARNNLATAHQSAGRLDQATRIFEAVVTDQRRVLGLEHPETVASLHNLGVAYLLANRLDEATSAFETCLDVSVRVLGSDHPRTRLTRDHLVEVLRATGRSAQASAVQAAAGEAEVRTRNAPRRPWWRRQ